MKVEYSQFNIQKENEYRRIFFECVRNIKCDYIFTTTFDILEIKQHKLDHNIVVIGLMDVFNVKVTDDFFGTDDTLYNGMFYVEKLLHDYTQQYKDKKFIIFSQHISEKLKINKSENVFCIHWSSLLLFNDYTNIEPITSKNKNTKQPVICLNRRMCTHRVALVSYLKSIDVNNLIYISALKMSNVCQRHSHMLDIVDWNFTKDSELFKLQSQQGYAKLCDNLDSLPFGQPYEEYQNSEAVIDYNNIDNFKNNLKKLYENSYLEFISETLYNVHSAHVTEKFLNSLYGKNFPILIACKGTVELLRDYGFDMFDDIIDHSYDSIDDPAMRMLTAINSNIGMLKNVKSLWKEHNKRFDHNIEVYKKLVVKLSNDPINTFNQYITHINT